MESQICIQVFSIINNNLIVLQQQKIYYQTKQDVRLYSISEKYNVPVRSCRILMMDINVLGKHLSKLKLTGMTQKKHIN